MLDSMQVICLVGLSDTWIKTEVQSEGKKEVFRRNETRLDSQKYEAKSISAVSWRNSADASKGWTNFFRNYFGFHCLTVSILTPLSFLLLLLFCLFGWVLLSGISLCRSASILELPEMDGIGSQSLSPNPFSLQGCFWEGHTHCYTAFFCWWENLEMAKGIG